MSNDDEQTIKDIYLKISHGSAQLIDVREQQEWHEFHFKKAHLFPLSELKNGKTPHFSKNTEIYLHCRSGKRVLIAEKILQKQGFTNVFPIKKDLMTLQKNGFEL